MNGLTGLNRLHIEPYSEGRILVYPEEKEAIKLQETSRKWPQNWQK